MVLRILSRKSRWNDFAEVYGEIPAGSFEENSLWLTEVYVGPVRYASAVEITSVDVGLTIRGWGPFRPWHPPFHIPADEIEYERVGSVQPAESEAIQAEGEYVRITTERGPGYRIHISAASVNQLGLHDTV